MSKDIETNVVVHLTETVFRVIVTIAIIAVLAFSTAFAEGDGLEVEVPEIVRRDIIERGVEFCCAVWPEIEKSYFRKRLTSQLESPTLKLRSMGTRLQIPIQPGDEDYNSIEYALSFPDGNEWIRVEMYGIRRKSPPGFERREVTIEEGEEIAAEVFERVRRFIPEEFRDKFNRFSKRERHGDFIYTWETERKKFSGGLQRVRIFLHARTGIIESVSISVYPLPYRDDKEIIPAEEMLERISELIPGSPDPKRLMLSPHMHAYFRRLRWDFYYFGFGGETWGDAFTTAAWDAYTGELVLAAECRYDQETGELELGRYRQGEGYRNPDYFPYFEMNEDGKIVRRKTDELKEAAERLARQRARRLEALAEGRPVEPEFKGDKGRWKEAFGPFYEQLANDVPRDEEDGPVKETPADKDESPADDKHPAVTNWVFMTVSAAAVFILLSIPAVLLFRKLRSRERGS